MTKMKSIVYKIIPPYVFLLLFSNILLGQICDPGDPTGNPGCPSGDCSGQSGTGFTIPIIFSRDPNEIIGPQGFGDKKWIAPDAIMPYKILFENDPDFATAPAQKVTVYLPIPSHLNPNSLRLSDFGFGSFNFIVPSNTVSYYQRLHVQDSLGVFVDVTAGLDQVNNRAFWIFESIDTATGLAATVPAGSGFLPVNDSLIHNGEGYVSLTLQPSSSAQSWDSVLAQADIIFDANDTIATNTEFNIIDADKPQSQIDTIISHPGNLITLNWSGNDNESGLRYYSIYYSANNAPYIPILTDTTITTIQFTGQNNTDYRFYSIARDSAGNKEDPPLFEDAFIHIGNSSLVLSLKVFIQGYYLSFETMSPVLKNQLVINDNTIADSITVELRETNYPFNTVTSTKSILHTNGLATVYFDSINHGYYYLVLRHRNCIETWSANPLQVHSQQISYDFSSSQARAYGNNMILLEPGIWGIYSGDINQDENIDLIDIGLCENTILNFDYGYLSEDINGDGNIDLLELPILEINISNFISTSRP